MRLISKAHKSLLQKGFGGIVNTLKTQMNKVLRDRDIEVDGA